VALVEEYVEVATVMLLKQRPTFLRGSSWDLNVRDGLACGLAAVDDLAEVYVEQPAEPVSRKVLPASGMNSQS
jgi:hypothetical protein